jgi:hypothetical protein
LRSLAVQRRTTEGAKIYKEEGYDCLHHLALFWVLLVEMVELISILDRWQFMIVFRFRFCELRMPTTL